MTAGTQGRGLMLAVLFGLAVQLAFSGGLAGAVTFKQEKDDRASNQTQLTISVPGPAKVNDFLVTQIAYLPQTGASLTPPAGWTFLSKVTSGSAIAQEVYTRVASANEPPNYAWTYSTSTTMAGTTLSYDGVDSAQPIDASDTAATAASTSVVLPSVTSTVAQTMTVLLYAVADNSATLTQPTGFTKEVTNLYTQGSNPGLTVQVADAAHPSVGATGALAATSSVTAAGVAHTLAIRGPVLGFATASSSGAESVTSVPLTVNLSGSVGVIAHVDYAVTSGTATAGQDYNLPSGTLDIPVGQTSGTINLAIVADTLAEGTETLTVTLSNPVNAVLGTVTTYTYSILDDDTNVQFSAASSTVAESQGSITLTVTRTGITTNAVSVNWATSGGSATSGTDFTAGSGTLSFASGETSKTLSVTVTDDTTPETDEAFTVALSSPSGATLGPQASTSVTILDDDTVASVAADPVGADGTLQVGARWGAWQVDPGTAAVDSVNYLKLTNAGNTPHQSVVIDFVPTTFLGVSDPTQTLPLDGNIQFAYWEDATPATSAPNEGTYTYGTASSDGSLSFQFNAKGNIIYVTYRVVSVPALIADQPYEATFRVS